MTIKLPTEIWSQESHWFCLHNKYQPKEGGRVLNRMACEKFGINEGDDVFWLHLGSMPEGGNMAMKFTEELLQLQGGIRAEIAQGGTSNPRIVIVSPVARHLKHLGFQVERILPESEEVSEAIMTFMNTYRRYFGARIPVKAYKKRPLSFMWAASLPVGNFLDLQIQDWK